MAKLTWDGTGDRKFETGVSKGVLYPRDDTGTYPLGVAWNGLTAVTDSPSGAEASAVYADNRKYANMVSAEECGGTIEALTYPDEWEACDGSAELGTGVTIGQQVRQSFGFSYQTLIGNDVVGTDLGYKIHLVYGAKAAPSEKAHNTVNDSPEAMTLSWEFTTDPIEVEGFKPTATLTIDSTTTPPAKLQAIEDLLYGTVGAGAKLPTPDEIKAILDAA